MFQADVHNVGGIITLLVTISIFLDCEREIKVCNCFNLSCSGNILYDQSGNANNGTIFGATWNNNTIAKSIYVSTSGSDENGDGTFEDPYFTIHANDGDSVFVAAGEYVENINLSGKNIALIGLS